MKRLKRKPKRIAAPVEPGLPECGQGEAGMVDNAEAGDDDPILGLHNAEADRELVKRCLAGEVAAWEEFYGEHHAPLCAAIRGMLGPGGFDLNRVDEIAARVWYELVRNDGELLDRFDPARDTRLGAFLRGLARMEIMKYFRTERRRRTRETASPSRDHGVSVESDWQVAAMIDDFAKTLSEGEQEFLAEHLLGEPEGSRKLSEASVWQRCHRIREKLKAFFSGPT